MIDDPCSYPNCPHVQTRSRTSRLCESHYYRKVRGQPMEPMPISRTPGVWSFKLEESSGYVRGFRVGANGYERRYEHQVVMERKLGRRLLEGENVHHINGVRHDNRPDNLELWSVKQPRGQRVEDKTEWAIEWLRTYRPEVLA